MVKKYSIPIELESNISKLLLSLNSSLEHSKQIADSVLKLSDYYIANPQSQTPWSERWCQVAYAGYYLPLNFLRSSRVYQEAIQSAFLNDIENIIDFGSGLGSASIPILYGSNDLNNMSESVNSNIQNNNNTTSLKNNFNFSFVERSEEARFLHKKLISHLNSKLQWQYEIKHQDIKNPKKTLAIFGYSLTELKQLPKWALECEAIMILEPSTQDDGRKLLKLREELLQQNFYIYAPCTHQKSCPLLVHSQRDWCHDRLHFEQPDWFKKVENLLPIKNQTLTFSYLIARKTPPTQIQENASQARTVGDLLNEKGKSRILICRGENREFLTWMHKEVDHVPEIYRGELISLPEDITQKSNELRTKSNL